MNSDPRAIFSNAGEKSSLQWNLGKAAIHPKETFLTEDSAIKSMQEINKIFGKELAKVTKAVIDYTPQYYVRILAQDIPKLISENEKEFQEKIDKMTADLRVRLDVDKALNFVKFYVKLPLKDVDRISLQFSEGVFNSIKLMMGDPSDNSAHEKLKNLDKKEFLSLKRLIESADQLINPKFDFQIWKEKIEKFEKETLNSDGNTKELSENPKQTPKFEVNTTSINPIIFSSYEGLGQEFINALKSLDSLKGLNFPIEKMHLMFIDKERMDKEKASPTINDSSLLFDVGKTIAEPGYKRAMLNAFDFIAQHIGNKNDLSFLTRLRDICVNAVKNENHQPFDMGMYPGCEYGIDMAKVTEAAKKEWEEEKLLFMNDNSEHEHEYNASLWYGNRISSGFKSEDNRSAVEKRLEEIFNTYERSIEQAVKTEDSRNAKLQAIVRLCRSVEMFHVFPDGNQRTIAFALLNKLLIENGFPPCILDDPYCFDGYFSAKEMVALVEKGFENFKAECIPV